MMQARLAKTTQTGSNLVLQRGTQVDILSELEVAQLKQDLANDQGQQPQPPQGFTLCRISGTPLLAFFDDRLLVRIQS
jgi:hypothetical protein